MTLVSDKECCVSGLWQDFNRMINCPGRSQSSMASNPQDLATTEILFEAELPVSIVCFRSGNILPAWCRRVEASDDAQDDSGFASARTEEAILGFGDDGSIYQFTLLDDAAWRLLYLVQNLFGRSRLSSPSYGGRLVRLPVAPQKSHPHLRHINGDLLMGLMEAGSGFLRELLDAKPAEADFPKYDYESAEARYRVFAALVDRVSNAPGDSVDRCMAYMTSLFRPLL
jgi:hypothetical protein